MNSEETSLISTVSVGEGSGEVSLFREGADSEEVKSVRCSMQYYPLITLLSRSFIVILGAVFGYIFMNCERGFYPHYADPVKSVLLLLVFIIVRDSLLEIVKSVE